MKTHFKSLLSSTVLISSLLAPTTVFAVEGPRPNTPTTTKTTCGAGLTALKGKLSSGLEMKSKERDAKKSEREAQKTTLRDTRNADLDKRKTAADAARDAEYAKLDEQAKTEAQKQAVVVFKATVKSAIEARRSTYDKARETFRAGVDAVVANHKTQADGQVAAYRAAVDAAVAKATTACQAASPDTAAIMATLKTELGNARKTFSDGRQVDTKVSDEIKVLVDARKKTVEEANKLFKSTMESARETLKTAWGSEI